MIKKEYSILYFIFLVRLSYISTNDPFFTFIIFTIQLIFLLFWFLQEVEIEI